MCSSKNVYYERLGSKLNNPNTLLNENTKINKTLTKLTDIMVYLLEC